MRGTGVGPQELSVFDIPNPLSSYSRVIVSSSMTLNHFTRWLKQLD
jgi:glucose-6-phosphate isomerase